MALTHIEQEILRRKFHVQSDKITIIPNFVTDDFVVEAKKYPNNQSRLGHEIGSHTCTHPILTELDSSRLDRKALVY